MEHKPGCSFKCFCLQENAQEAVQKCQKAVTEAERALIEMRNSGVDEEVIADAVRKRHTAQENLDAAYKYLIDVCSIMPDKIKDVDDEEAEDSDLSEGEGEGEDVETSGIHVLNSSAVEDEDDDDEEYVPPSH